MKSAFAILIIITFLSAAYCGYAIDDKIIAVVNNDIITLQELKSYLSSTYMQLSSSGKSKEEIEGQMEAVTVDGLEKLIERKLLVDEADHIELIIIDDAVKERIDEIKDYYTSEDAFLKALTSDGMTVSDLIKTITDQLKAKSIIDMAVRSQVFVTPSEITKYYQENMDVFFTPQSINLQSIFIPYAGDEAAAKQKARKAFELSKESGADFDAIAKKYSQSSHIGIVKKGEFLAKLEKIVFNLKQGEISTPFAVETGIYIFKAKESFPKKHASLEEVRDDIREILLKKKFDERMGKWMKELKEKAYIEIKK